MSAESPVIICQARILLPTNEFLVGDVELRGGQIVQVAPQLSLSDQPSPDRTAARGH